MMEHGGLEMMQQKMYSRIIISLSQLNLLAMKQCYNQGIPPLHE